MCGVSVKTSVSTQPSWRRTPRLPRQARAVVHSVKKILRRNGASNIKCKKVKRKQESVGPQKQRQDTDYKLTKYGGNTGRRGDDVEMKEPKATAACREAHAALGKLLRRSRWRSGAASA